MDEVPLVCEPGAMLGAVLEAAVFDVRLELEMLEVPKLDKEDDVMDDPVDADAEEEGIPILVDVVVEPALDVIDIEVPEYDQVAEGELEESPLKLNDWDLLPTDEMDV